MMYSRDGEWFWLMMIFLGMLEGEPYQVLVCKECDMVYPFCLHTGLPSMLDKGDSRTFIINKLVGGV